MPLRPPKQMYFFDGHDFISEYVTYHESYGFIWFSGSRLSTSNAKIENVFHFYPRGYGIIIAQSGCNSAYLFLDKDCIVAIAFSQIFGISLSPFSIYILDLQTFVSGIRCDNSKICVLNNANINYIHQCLME